MKKNISAAILAVSLFVFLSRFSFAVDITIDVPVQLRNLHPNLFQGSVTCGLYEESGRIVTNSGGSGVAGSQTFLISGGNYTGVASVVMDTSDPSRGRRWACQLSLMERLPGDTRGYSLNERQVLDRYGRDATAASIWVVEGPFTPPALAR